MAFFLQIVLAIVLVVGPLVLAAWLWLRFRIRRAIHSASAINVALQHFPLEPARLRLSRATMFEPGAAAAALKQRLQNSGFRRMADLEDWNGSCGGMIATRHRELPIAAAITENDSGEAAFVMFAMTRERNVIGRGNAGAEAFANARVDWRNDPDLTPEAALDELSATVGDAHLPFDLKLFRAVYEQVYAARMDQRLVHRPQREPIEQMAGSLGESWTDEQIDVALECLVQHWKSQIEAAVLDRYRRSNRIDSVEWDALESELQVVHSRMDNEDIADLLVSDELSEKLFDQFVAQGLGGIDLFEAVAERLPPDRQWQQLAELSQPVRALIFAPDQDIDSDVAESRPFVYAAENEDGEEKRGSVVAATAADAKAQIAALGLRNARLLITPFGAGEQHDEVYVDEEFAGVAARAASESTFASVFRAFVANWLVWAPPVPFIAMTVMEGGPFGWGDYIVFAWSALALAWLVLFVCPMIFYNQLLGAQLRAKPGQQRFWIALLAITGRFAGLTASQIAAERAKVMAEEGRLEEALAAWAKRREAVSDEEYEGALVAVYGRAGAWPEMIETQRRLLGITQSRETAAIDLAMSIARYCDDVEPAEKLIQSVSAPDLPELALIGFNYVRGLLAAFHGQHAQAVKHYAQAIETAKPFDSVPIVLGLIAEINGYTALSLRRLGDEEQAQALWRRVLPVIEPHPSSQRLIAAYGEA